MEELAADGTYRRYDGYSTEPFPFKPYKAPEPIEPSPAEDARPAFEAWIVREYGSGYAKRDQSGRYLDWEVNNDWRVWQAAWLAKGGDDGRG